MAPGKKREVTVRGVSVAVPSPDVFDDYRLVELLAGEPDAEQHLPVFVNAALGSAKQAVFDAIKAENGGRLPVAAVVEAVGVVVQAAAPN